MDELQFNLVPSSACESIARLLCMYIINFKNIIIIMAKNVINEKGFKIIALTTEECKDIGFGFQYIDKHKNANNYCWDLICDNCNKLIIEHKEVYYIPVLNRIFCQQCLINWYDNATYYPEDKRYENKKYEMLIANLKANNIVIEEHTKKIL